MLGLCCCVWDSDTKSIPISHAPAGERDETPPGNVSRHLGSLDTEFSAQTQKDDNFYENDFHSINFVYSNVYLAA